MTRARWIVGAGTVTLLAVMGFWGWLDNGRPGLLGAIGGVIFWTLVIASVMYLVRKHREQRKLIERQERYAAEQRRRFMAAQPWNYPH